MFGDKGEVGMYSLFEVRQVMDMHRDKNDLADLITRKYGEIIRAKH